MCTSGKIAGALITSSQVAPTTGLYWNTMADSHAQPLHPNATLGHNTQTCYVCECVRIRNFVNYLWICVFLHNLVSRIYSCTVCFYKYEYSISSYLPYIYHGTHFSTFMFRVRGHFLLFLSDLFQLDRDLPFHSIFQYLIISCN